MEVTFAKSISKFGNNQMNISNRNLIEDTWVYPTVNMPNTLNMTQLCFTTLRVQTQGGATEMVY